MSASVYGGGKREKGLVLGKREVEKGLSSAAMSMAGIGRIRLRSGRDELGREGTAEVGCEERGMEVMVSGGATVVSAETIGLQ